MNLFNQTTLILLGGITVLFLNILYGLVRTARGHMKAGWFTVAIALVSCAMILVGTVQVTVANASAPSSATTARARYGGGAGATGAGGGSGAGGGFAARLTATAAAAVPGAATTDGATATPSAPDAANASPTAAATRRYSGTPRAAGAGAGANTANPNGVAPAAAASNADPNSTPAAADAAGTNPTPAPTRRARGTPGVAGTNGGNGAGGNPADTSGNNAAGGNGAATGGGSSGSANPPGNFVATSAPVTNSIDASVLQLALIGGGVELVLAFILYRFERRRQNFAANGSRGLLNLGAAFFVLVAVFVIPLIPGQLAGGALPVSAAAAPGGATRPAPVITRVLPSATPTPLAPATATPTPLPTFTVTPTFAPPVMPTQIPYVADNAGQPTAAAPNGPTDTAKTATKAAVVCTVSVTNNVNLRSGPAATNTLLLTIPAGTTLNVSGRTADKQWWQIQATADTQNQAGWVNSQYATPNSDCSHVPTVKAP
jgi:hypothetical protein